MDNLCGNTQIIHSIVADFQSAMWSFGILGKFWSVKFIEILDCFQVLFRSFKQHGPLMDLKDTQKSKQ